MSIELPSGLPWVALDTETSGLHPDDGARVACVALTHRDWSVGLPFDQGARDKMPNPQLGLDLFGGGVDPNLPREDWEYLLRWLLDQRLVFHNAKFDLAMMRVGTRHWPGVELVERFIWDTMLAQVALDPLEMKGLDVTCQRLGLGAKTGLEELQGWLKANKFDKYRYDLAPWDLVEPYVTADTQMTSDLYENQIERLSDRVQFGDPDPRYDRIQRQFALTRALYEMEKRGIGYDDVASLEAAEKIEKTADDIEESMPFKCTPTAAHAYFYGQMKLTADRVSEKTGRPSLDEEQVRKWVKDQVPWASEYARVTKFRRASSMWYRGYPEKIGRDGRLRCTYRQGHVKSGRMSVERVQLQALPKSDKNLDGIPGVRELIQAESGFGLWNLDLSQAELRVASHYSQCRRMIEQLAAGEDIHSNTNREVLHAKESDPNWKTQRDIAKRLTFGGIFQIGAETFQGTLSKLADIHLPLSECQTLIQGWRRMYPEFGTAYRRADKMATEKKYVRLLPNTPYEVRSYFGERDYPNTAWNRVVQGSLAEAFGMWLGEIERRWPGYAILTVHDSIVFEAKLDEGDQIAAEVATFGSEFMTDLFGCTMKVDIDRW